MDSFEIMHRTLKAWQEMVYRLSKERPDLDSMTYRRVTVMVEDRLPDEPVHLQFAAPQEILEHFRQTLQGQGYNLSEQVIIPGLISVYKMHFNLHG